MHPLYKANSGAAADLLDGCDLRGGCGLSFASVIFGPMSESLEAGDHCMGILWWLAGISSFLRYLSCTEVISKMHLATVLLVPFLLMRVFLLNRLLCTV